jgi:hypothetical protein
LFLAEKQGCPGNYLTLFFVFFRFFEFLSVQAIALQRQALIQPLQKNHTKKPTVGFSIFAGRGTIGFSMNYEMPSRNDAIGTTDGPTLLHGCGYCTEAGRLCHCVHPWFSSAWIRGTLTP